MATKSVLRRTTVRTFLRPTTSYVLNTNQYACAWAASNPNLISPVGVRHYPAAGLKELKNRITTIQSIVKVTSSMKMIANAKLAKQQERLKEARVWHRAAFGLMDAKYPQLDKKDEFYADKKEQQDTEDVGPEVLVTIASDRGLCGGVNSNIGREVIRLIRGKPNAAIAMIGDKTLQQIQREWSKQFTLAISGVSGNKPIVFHEALAIAEKILAIPAEKYTVVFSYFHNMVTYHITNIVFPSVNKMIEDEGRFQPFQWQDENILRSAYAYSFASFLFYAITESQTSEIAARMTAMDNATANGRDLIKILSLAYNKQRQTSITTELVEIVSGASAQDEAKKKKDED